MSCNSNVNIILKIQADKIQASFFELRSCDNQAGVFFVEQNLGNFLKCVPSLFVFFFSFHYFN